MDRGRDELPLPPPPTMKWVFRHSWLTIIPSLGAFLAGTSLWAVEPSPVFIHIWDSDEWVNRSIQVQRTYRRVLVVDTSAHPPHDLAVAALSLNSRADTARPKHRYRVSAVFRTLQEAADQARGGDLVAVMPGNYWGFVLEDTPTASDRRYIHFKAMGEPGQVPINQPSRVPDWMILLRAAHHVIVEGFNIAGSNAPGLPVSGPRAVIMLDGEFRNTGKQTHHIVLLANFSHNHRKWGFHTRDTHTVLIQDNLFALSALEHSGYVSNGSDNYLIRRNIFFGSNSGGLQCNLDPLSSLEDLSQKPELRNYGQEQPTREWRSDC